MPTGSEVERRDQAVFALAALTAMRDGALASLRLKHIDIERRLVMQNPLEVQTKFSKRIDTFFFRIGDNVEEIVEQWVHFLKVDKLYGNDDPLFPRTRLALDANQCWVACGLEPTPWSTAGPIRKIFKEAFVRVGLDYFVPHSFRNTVVQWGESNCSSIEEFKALSQNLGHSGVLTSLTSYGHVPLHRQGELIRSVVRKKADEAGKLDEILDLLKRGQQ
jgi:integrase